MLKQTAILNLLGVGVILLLVGCSSQPKPIYMWGKFPHQQYDTLLRAGWSVGEQIQVLQAQMEKAKAKDSLLPPGFRAHLGMLYLSAGDVDAARNLWTAEKTIFPESALYINQLLKRLDGSSNGKSSS